MLLAGDERGRTQDGNNNAYCQDGPLTWIAWTPPDDPDLIEFVRAVIELRRTNAAFRRELFFRGEPLPDGSRKDLTWLRPDGREMEEADWFDAGRRVIGLLFGDDSGQDERLFAMFLNAHDGDFPMELPAHAAGWELLIDTAGNPRSDIRFPLPVTGTLVLRARSLQLFRTRARREA
jgi:glycogen operon protein